MAKKKIKDCLECETKSACCKEGVWVDLGEAKKIMKNTKYEGFYDLQKDSDFPSGWKIATSYEDGPCGFRDRNGLCVIHKISYDLKPSYCKEFPLQDGKLSSDYERLCGFLEVKRKP